MSAVPRAKIVGVGVRKQEIWRRGREICAEGESEDQMPLSVLEADSCICVIQVQSGRLYPDA